jgi:hypothetical protein
MLTRIKTSHHSHGTRSGGKRHRRKETPPSRKEKRLSVKKRAKKATSPAVLVESQASKVQNCCIDDDFFDYDDDDDGDLPVLLPRDDDDHASSAVPDTDLPVADNSIIEIGLEENVFAGKTPVRDLNIDLDAIVNSIDKHQAITTSDKPKLNMQTTGNSVAYATNQVKEVEKFVAFLGECKFYFNYNYY